MDVVIKEAPANDDEVLVLCEFVNCWCVAQQQCRGSCCFYNYDCYCLSRFAWPSFTSSKIFMCDSFFFSYPITRQLQEHEFDDMMKNGKGRDGGDIWAFKMNHGLGRCLVLEGRSMIWIHQFLLNILTYEYARSCTIIFIYISQKNGSRIPQHFFDEFVK